MADESLDLDVAQVLAGTNGDSHWRERAVIWRERALAAELVAKMLQRNLDDLRANLEDLRVEVAAIASSEPPWRRFVRDLYDKYLG